MHRPARFVVVLLLLSLTGGAQACVALCAVPAPTAGDNDRSSCRHCAEKTEKPVGPGHEEPCKHCRVISQENWATKAHGASHVDLDWQSVPLALPSLVVVSGGRALPPLPAMNHGPPGERLHQFCLLLI
jgi:hypothetical protein